MRVTSGKFGGRSLKTASGPGYRPATDKVRQAIFSMLQARGLDYDGLRVADFFAGSGSLAVEALSRGADYALLVEKSKPAAAVIRDNLRTLGVGADQAKVLPMDLFKVLKKSPDEPFGLVFIDPPYGKNLLVPALEAGIQNRWFAPGAFVLAEVETAIDPGPDGEGLGLVLETNRAYGQTRIVLWTVKEEE